MGVLNVTPDSFSDGGEYMDRDLAVEHGLELVAAGADVVDVGGESSRPGAEPVSEAEELRRVVPVVAALSASVRVSVDTTKPTREQRW
jgi:dihydropteroate synthase